MGLSIAFVDAHVTAWEARLQSPYYPYRERWPSRLFHHAPIENALSIVRSGQLLSRNDSAGERARDIAAPGVIDASVRAHRFARLYFRPRTPTQFHIEGIRKQGECKFGDETHTPILTMFVFDARRVLTLEGTHFSAENMQTGGIEDNTEAAFAGIPFDKVYSEGGIGGDMSIIKHRCAEVLAVSPLPLDGCLQWIYCRSSAEKETLLHLLGDHSLGWEGRIQISDDLKVFQKEFAFVETVSLANNGVVFGLNPRSDGKNLSISLKATPLDGGPATEFQNESMAAKPTASGLWRVESAIQPGAYEIVIQIDGHLAYHNVLTYGDVPF